MFPRRAPAPSALPLALLPTLLLPVLLPSALAAAGALSATKPANPPSTQPTGQPGNQRASEPEATPTAKPDAKPADQPEAKPDGKPDPSRPSDADPNNDPALKQLVAALSLNEPQTRDLALRFRTFRQSQRSAIREIMQAIRASGDRGGPPSPEDRAKAEPKMKEKLDLMNAAFLSEVRGTLSGAQRAKFDEVAPKLDLSPVRGPQQQSAGAQPFNLKNQVTIEEKDGYRLITSNSIPDHEPGKFPGPGNPNAISEQKFSFRITMTPKVADKPTPHRMALAGVALNGVVFEPGTAENWKNDPRSGWRQEAISPLMNGGAKLGLDAHNAHVQPNGMYHYHALPTGLLKRLAKEKGVNVGEAMILLGWAADGFPIYDYHGYSKADDAKSPIKELHSSYKLKPGNRPDESANPPGPGGPHDGSYTRDFEFVAGSGDLDECNGRFGVTPEFPNGTYYYVITAEFPFISRMFRGTPDPSVSKNDGPPGGGPGGGGPGGGGPGGRGPRGGGPGGGPPNGNPPGGPPAGGR